MRRMGAGLAAGLLLAAVLSACGPSTTDRPVGALGIAGGGATGVYFAYGTQLAGVLSRDLDVEAAVAETNGSVDNLERIGAGDAVLGFAQSDTAADAVSGTGAFDAPLPIRAVARLYDEYVHLVVRGDSDATAIADLAGATVSLGAENSGVNVVATRILAAAGVVPGSLQNTPLSLTESIDALQQGQIEAFFWVGGLPTPGIAELADTTSIRLLPIDADIVERVNARYAGVYGLADLPLGVYGRNDPTPTMTVPNFLVTSADVPDGLVRDVLEVLFDTRVEIAELVPAAALLDRREAIFTAPIELHPGAVEYYRDARG